MRESLPLWKRIDCVCVLNRGVILNQVQDGTFDALPQPGSRLGYRETERALLLFYALISRCVFQAQIPRSDSPNIWDGCASETLYLLRNRRLDLYSWQNL